MGDVDGGSKARHRLRPYPAALDALGPYQSAKCATRDPFVRLDVLGARPRDHRGRNRRRGRGLVPTDGEVVVAHVLLVEARRRATGRVRIGRPVPRRVGGEHLVDQQQFAVGASCRTRTSYPPAGSRATRRALRLVRRSRARRREPGEGLRADEIDRLGVGHREVVAGIGLGGRGEQRLREELGFLHPARHRPALHRRRFLGIPSTPRRRDSPAQCTPCGTGSVRRTSIARPSASGRASAGKVGRIHADHMVRQQVGGEVEPEAARSR